MALSSMLRHVAAIGLLVVLAFSSIAGGTKPRDLYTHQHIPFPKLRLLRQQKEFSKQCGIPVKLLCSSLLGPECFYSIASRGNSQVAEHLQSVPARKGGEKMERISTGGIMQQYMEASQSLLGSAQSDTWGSTEEGKVQRTGQRMDDVVMVKVGRSVKSVYDEDDQETWPDDGAGVDKGLARSRREAGHEREEDFEGHAGLGSDNAESSEQCENDLESVSERGSTDEGPLSVLRELDTTQELKQVDSDVMQEQEYYDHYFNTTMVDPNDEYYGEYDDPYYIPAE